jgi:hypothetical protein
VQAAFILTLNTGDDTDLIGIAEELKFYVEDRFEVISCHPWAREELPPQDQQQNQQ